MNVIVSSASYVFSDHIPGGEFQIAHAIVRRLADRGHRLHVFAPRVNLEQTLQNVDVHELGGFDFISTNDYTAYYRNYYRFARRARRLASKLIRGGDIDVIHHIRPAYPRMFSLCHDLGVPFVYGPMSKTWSSEADAGGNARWESRPWSPLTDRIVDRLNFSVGSARWQSTVDGAAAIPIAVPSVREQQLPPDYPDDRSPVIPNGVDGDTFSPSENRPATPVILFVGKLEARKGLDYLIDAMPELVRQSPDTRLIVVGSGRDEQASRDRCREMGLDKQVSFIGELPFSDMPDLFRRASIFCLPSLGEPFGLTVLQAMAAGLPIVATDAGGIPEFLTHEESALLVPPRDGSAIANAIGRLITDTQLRESMGRLNRERVESTFDWERVVDRIEQVYREVSEA